MECCNAHLNIRDGYVDKTVTLATVCGTSQDDGLMYVAKSGSAEIHFHSDVSDGAGAGFQINYRVKNKLQREYRQTSG